VRFLVGECLSVELVTVAAEAGYEAHHVAHVGKAGRQDWNVLRHAYIDLSASRDDSFGVYQSVRKAGEGTFMDESI